MSAVNAPLTQPAADASADSRSHEPSMEDILASIRRIIADDQSRTAAHRRPEPAPPPPAIEPEGHAEPAPVKPEPEEAVAVARPEIFEPMPHLNAPPLPVSIPDAEFHEIDSAGVTASAEPHAYPVHEPEPASWEPESEPEVRHAAPEPEEPVDTGDRWLDEPAMPPLVSAETGASVGSSFQALATTLFMQNTGMVEQMMRDELRPMLKAWLDDNLPTIVERLVRVEIERVARGSRG